jgi:hypothetical protein
MRGQWVHLLQNTVEWLLPLKCYLANATALVFVVSITWTLLLLKNRWFNSFLVKLGVDAQGSLEVHATFLCT